MLIFKIVFSAYGDNFYPENYLPILIGDLKVIDVNSPSNTGNDYGNISFMHSKIFGIFGEDLDYEEEFISFYENNCSSLIKCGVTNFDFFVEVYYSDEQCNFEILNRSMLNRLYEKNNNLAFPVSTYHLKEEQIKELMKSIQDSADL